MKKTIVFLILFLVFLLIYFLQMNFFSWFTIAGVMPNLFVILILTIGLFTGRAIGITTGIIARDFIRFFYRKKYRYFSYNARNNRIYWRIFR